MISPLSSIGMGVTSRGFIPPEEVAAVERQPIAMVRSHLSWGSIIAGSLLCVSLLVLSSSLAIACGIPAFVGTGTYGTGAFLWSVITAILAFGAGGCLSAFVASTVDRGYPVLHGAMSWALSLALLVTLFGGVTSILGQTGMLAAGVRGMTLSGSGVAAAWGIFVSLALGLVSASLAGPLLQNRLQQRPTTVA